MDMRQVEEVVKIEQAVWQKNYTIGIVLTIVIVKTMTGFYNSSAGQWTISPLVASSVFRIVTDGFVDVAYYASLTYAVRPESYI